MLMQQLIVVNMIRTQNRSIGRRAVLSVSVNQAHWAHRGIIKWFTADAAVSQVAPLEMCSKDEKSIALTNGYSKDPRVNWHLEAERHMDTHTKPWTSPMCQYLPKTRQTMTTTNLPIHWRQFLVSASIATAAAAFGILGCKKTVRTSFNSVAVDC